MELFNISGEKTFSIVAKMFEMLEGETDCQSFEVVLKQELDCLGREILYAVSEVELPRFNGYIKT